MTDDSERPSRWLSLSYDQRSTLPPLLCVYVHTQSLLDRPFGPPGSVAMSQYPSQPPQSQTQTQTQQPPIPPSAATGTPPQTAQHKRVYQVRRPQFTPALSAVSAPLR